MMRKSIWLVLVALLVTGLVAMMVAGCGGTTDDTSSATTDAGDPVIGGVAKIGKMGSAAFFGFPKNVRGPDQWWEGLFLEQMFNPTGEVDVYAPMLAESWELTADKSAYIFHLRQGVKFVDGTDFNAEAAKFCWDLNLTAAPAGGAPAGGAPAGGAPAGGAPAGGPPPGPAPDFAFVDSIEVVDTYTVQINLKKWTNEVLAFIGRKSWAVFSPTAYEANGAEWMQTHPVGTGAWMLKEFVPDQKMVLEKNPNYWGKDAQGRQLPYMDGVEITMFSDPTPLTVALQAGQLDGTDQASLVGADQLQTDKNLTLFNFGGPIQMIELNTTDPNSVWSDVRMRQALEYAIDKEGLSASVGMGFTKPAYSIMHSIDKVVDAGTTPRKYDPAKAKALMAEAGHAQVECTINYDQTRGDPNEIAAIQANLAAVGINAKLNGMTTAAFSPISVKVPEGNDLMLQGMRGAAPNVLQAAIEMLAKGTIYFPGFSPPAEFYTLMDKAQTYENLTEALPDIASMEKIAYDDAQLIPTTYAAFISVTGPKLKNMQWFLGNTPTPWFNEAWLAQ
jgi:peptide/nickel transport system substrate-binding protein